MKGHNFLKVTGILMIIAAAFSILAIKGIKHSKCTENARKLITWGVVVALFSVLSIVFSAVNSGEFNVTSLLTGVLVPGLYIYGAVLNAKADDAQTV